MKSDISYEEIIKKVSLHACERYMQRILEIECPESSLSTSQALLISRAIIKILLAHHPEAFNLKNGTFKCKDDDLACVMQSGMIVTIKETRKASTNEEWLKTHNNTPQETLKMTDKKHSKHKKENNEFISKYR